MLGRVQPQKSFGDEALELHVSDSHFLVKVAGLVDWAAFDSYWPRLYGTTGKPSSDPLVCFKMLLLEQWYNLSDPECEAQCADRLSFRRFLGLSLADSIPDETVLVRFRKRLVKAGIAEALFAAVLAQVEAAGVIIKRGTLVDATIVQSARKAPPKGETGGDPEASWAVKGNRPIAHGFKAHIAVDDGSEIVRAIATTTGATHDSTPADKLINRAPAKAVYADAAYCDTERRKALRDRGVFPRIRFNPRNGELTMRQTALNYRWAKVRAKVEHVFADWKERRSLGRCRYVGLRKNALHFTLLAIAHNMRRWSVLAA
jgi:IS5 family transposase